MKRKIFILGLIVCMIFALCGCTKTVENADITLNLNGIGEKEGTYTGEVIDGTTPNGNGKFTTKNDSGIEWYYDGTWVDGQMDGQGITEWKEIGQKHEGLYKNGLYTGEGKFYEKGVLVYEGEFANDLYDGKGKLMNADGKVVYEGEFKAGIPVDKDAIKSSAKKLSYDELARNEMTYFGDIVTVSGRIIQVMEGEDGYAEYRLALDDMYKEVVYLTYQRPEGEARILEGDTITVYGISEGLFTYESTGSGDITIPWLFMVCR